MPGVHAGAWEVVCLCALGAMERGRRAGWQRLLEGQAPGPALVPSLRCCAVARFWELLADFCAVDAAPQAWRRELRSSHPFLSFDTHNAQWRVRRP